MDIEKFTIDKERSCLLVIDIQERLFNSMEYEIRKNVVKNAGILIETAKVFGIPIIVTEQYSKGLGPTIPDVKQHIPDIVPLDKNHFDCMQDEAISKKVIDLQKRIVIICGIETHICVLYTALALLRKGFNVVIASDAVCSRRTHEWKMGIRSLRDAGAIVYSTETISFMLIGRSGTEEFKKLSPLFK